MSLRTMRRLGVPSVLDARTNSWFFSFSTCARTIRLMFTHEVMVSAMTMLAMPGFITSSRSVRMTMDGCPPISR